jgi:uncharacterized SAM-binding protein YcdF (DUF218 family)
VVSLNRHSEILNSKDAPAKKKKRSWSLLKRRSCLLPTARGWLLFLLVFTFAGLFLARHIHPFLALNDPLPGGILVVEGWAPDSALKDAIAEFHRNHYEKVFVTGIPLEHGGPLSEFNNYAELGSAVLIKLGMPTNEVQAVPTPNVIRDRTYTSAITLKKWLREHSMPVSKINLFTSGPHARRSRLLYEKAMGKDVAIGVIARPVDDYDPEHWWRSSPGFRTVTGETMAYLYARILFRTPKE